MRHFSRVLCLCAVFGAVFLAPADAQQTPTPPPSVQVRSEEVLLDVVVRDKKGHAVNNLKPEDLQIFDNGEQKKITSFRLVQGSEAVTAGGSRTQLDPLRQIRLVTMIFQCWNNDARGLARDAASNLLKGELPQNVYVAVMTIDHKLEVLQPYTNDLALLHKAVDRATRSEAKDYSADTAMVQKQLEEMLGPNTSGALTQQTQADNAQAKLAAQGRGASGADFAGVAMAQMVLQMLQTQQASAARESGRIDIYALLDAVREQYRLPGRKTVLYFREGGFMIPQGMEQPFNNVISVANRSNVSFYSIDARGLSTSNANTDAMTGLNNAAQSSQRQSNDTGQETTAHEEGERAKAIDTALESTRSNTQNTLANLAESTGGSLIANTNDLKGPLRRVEEDIQTYYEISYNPEIKSYDGSFRKITVKANSNDLRIQSRSGYVALPPELALKGDLLRSYEVPLLTALSSDQPPDSFTFHSEAMHFRGPQDQSVCNLVMDVPLANVTFQKNTTDQAEGRLSYVALVKDGKGEVLKKFRNDVPIHLPSGKLEAFKAGHYIYTEHFDLPPGHYTLETAVLDGAGNKISVRKHSLMMPAAAATLAMSSVSIVRNTKDKDVSTDEADPLLVGAKLISPTLSPVINKADSGGVSFYMVLYLDKNLPTLPTLSMEFSRDGQVLGSGSPELGKPDKDNRIQYVATVPTTSLDPGEYTIRFIATQGPEAAVETASFTLH